MRSATFTEGPMRSKRTQKRLYQRMRAARLLIPQVNLLRIVASQHFPKVFNAEQPVPLAEGFKGELLSQMPQVPPAVANLFLGRWTSRREYLEALSAPGAVRYHLDGSVAEPVTEEHRIQAACRLDGSHLGSPCRQI